MSTNNFTTKTENYIDEVWKDIPGYPEYQVSSFGRVKSFKQNKTEGEVLNPGWKVTGYLAYRLSTDNNPKNLMAHRLVALAFIPNPEDKPQVHHRDGHRKNNHVSNLEWVTSQENNQYRAQDRLLNGRKPDNGKINEDVVFDIKIALMLGLTQEFIAEKYGVSKWLVQKINSGRNWGHVKPPWWDEYLKTVQSPKMDEATAIKIKTDLVSGLSQKEIANKYGFGSTTISNIANGKTWASVVVPGWYDYLKSKQKHSGKNTREENVVYIKKLLELGKLTHQEIADVFGVSRATVGDISTGKTHSTVTI